MDINEVALRIFCSWEGNSALTDKNSVSFAYDEAERFMAEGRRRGYIEKEPAEARKRYRIKTKEEAFLKFGNDWRKNCAWVPDMNYLFGREVESNEEQHVDGWVIIPDMITEIKDGE